MSPVIIPEEIRTLNPDNIDFNNPEAVKTLILKLLNIIELQAQILENSRKENQELKNEINRLKGEKGKPEFSPNVTEKEDEIRSPNKKDKKNWTKSEKKPRIKIDRTIPIEVDKNTLPPDAEHKGYRTVIVQNINFSTDNVEYILERYYSPSEKKLYEAKLPDGVDSEFGPELKTFIVFLYYACRVTENKIKKILEDWGIIISEGEISNILTQEKKEELSIEKEEILKAGMANSNYIHMDDTGIKHKGENQYFHVICNLLFSVFFITRNKNSDTIRGILGLNEEEKLNKILISDDAKQFSDIAIYHALCWIHEIRLYKKLNPVLEYHRIQLLVFIGLLWEFYDKLNKYRENPDEKLKFELEMEFDELFSIKTGYDELDKRIALTKDKKQELLLVLVFPEIPIHNNPAELALREIVVKRKISSGTRSDDGKIAWENMMSILDTCRKHGINFFNYILDIFSNKCLMSKLATLISQNDHS